MKDLNVEKIASLVIPRNNGLATDLINGQYVWVTPFHIAGEVFHIRIPLSTKPDTLSEDKKHWKRK